MVLDLAASGQYKQLGRIGPRPTEALVKQVLKAGPAAVAPLTEIAADLQLFDAEAPEYFAPLHALRLLGELNSSAIVEPLLNAPAAGLPTVGENLLAQWSDEAAQMIARLGPQVFETLVGVLDDPAREDESKVLAYKALAYMTVAHPETFDAVADVLLQRLHTQESTLMTSYVVLTISQVGVASAYSEVMALFKEGKVDRDVIQPGLARQLLLTKDTTSRLACVKHSFWERYDQHPLERYV